MALILFDQETWKFINSFAPWASAAGTLAAVLFSLYITVADRSRVRVRAWKNRQPSADETSTYELISIRIINSRDKEVFIDKVYWKVGGTITPQVINYTFALNLDLTGPSMLVGKVPTQINFDFDTFKKRFLPKLAPSLLENRSSVKIGVSISTGKRFESAIDKDLQDWLINAAREVADSGLPRP